MMMMMMMMIIIIIIINLLLLSLFISPLEPEPGERRAARKQSRPPVWKLFARRRLCFGAVSHPGQALLDGTTCLMLLV